MKKILIVFCLCFIGCGSEDIYVQNDVCTVEAANRCSSAYCTNIKVSKSYKLNCNLRGYATLRTNEDYKLGDLIIFKSEIYWGDKKK